MRDEKKTYSKTPHPVPSLQYFNAQQNYPIQDIDSFRF